MGYDVHITRASDWTESEKSPITLNEWKLYVQSDPEMRLDNFAEATTTAGEKLRIDEEGIAVWTAYSGHDPNGNMAWFGHCRGEITVKNPDAEILQKMRQIAASLGAQVMGDEREAY